MSLSFSLLRQVSPVFLTCGMLLFAGIPGAAEVGDMNDPNAPYYTLTVRVGDTTGLPGEQNSVISVYMQNFADTVAGFELWLMLQNPELVAFQTDSATFYDTTYWRCLDGEFPSCLDSMEITDSVLIYGEETIDPDTFYVDIYDLVVGNHDTTGTLVGQGDWQFVRSKATSLIGNDLKIGAYSNDLRPPYTPGIGFPQFGDIPLIRILADIADIPDDYEDRTSKIWVIADNLDNFSFSNEHGNGIGVITDTVLDTSWFECDIWDPFVGETCYYWIEVAEGPIDSVDSFWCCDTITIGYLDTSKVKITHGSITVLYPPDFVCGNIDCDEGDYLNILDVSYLINYLYKNGPEPCVLNAADVDCSENLNILDASYMVNFLYKNGPEPNCPPDCLR